MHNSMSTKTIIWAILALLAAGGCSSSQERGAGEEAAPERAGAYREAAPAPSKAPETPQRSDGGTAAQRRQGASAPSVAPQARGSEAPA
ncbi:hypothetical protein, partial [Paenibacillus contaminans]